MYYNNAVIGYLQANKILALKLDHAFRAVNDQVTEQLETIGAGATRMIYYTSCFTEEYQEVCQRQKREDIRFSNGVVQLFKHGDVIYEMLKLYFEEIFRYKTSEQLEYIKRMLMAVNVHIAASSLTNTGFALAIASFVAVGTNLSINMSALTGRWSSKGLTGIGVYGVIQKAADSANHLRLTYPAYYAALYAHELEMMYFLIAPLFERAEAHKAQWASDNELASIIARMIG